ncbi:glycosyltransferase family 4 protein [Rothia halotolerans]|uniref:glycosyltransferase family 4 protein n=1 Tax=Rothia halotolerans TaxID=405770 RepID=UPI00101C268E|nr:glycosyltransferase family 4 protein [Rothia halotolerans]
MTSPSSRGPGPVPPVRLVLVEPADLPGPSGGLVFNASLVRALRGAGHDVEVRRVPGAWPRPAEEDLRALERTLGEASDPPGRPTILVDGIVASAAPAQVRSARAAGADVVVLVHLPLPAETGLSAEEGARLAASEREALSAASGVICTSRWAARDLGERYGVRDAVVLEPGVDPAATARGSDPPLLLLLGSVTPRKNPLTVLRALRRLVDLPWRVSVTGPYDDSSPYVRRVLEAASALGPGRAEVTGPLTGAALEEVWARTDLLVLASRAETYGMVVAEAHAHGVPALVGAGTAAEEVLRGGPRADGVGRTGRGTLGREETGGSEETDGEGAGRMSADELDGLGKPGRTGQPGAAVPPDDEAAVAAALRRWLTDPALRHAWREAARQRRGNLRSWEQTAQTLAAYLSRPRPRNRS